MKKNTYLWQSAVTIFFFGLFEFLGFLQPLRAVGEKAVAPLLSLTTQFVSIMETPYFVVRRSFQNYHYVEDLELQYTQALSQLSELDQLRAENKELKSMIEKNATTTAHTRLIAPIISYSQPTISRGSEDGVTEGEMVMISDTLVGVVGHTSAAQSSVSLLTQTATTPVLAKTQSGVTGVVHGDGNQVMLQELPIDAQVQVGDMVTAAGQDNIPQGTLIGRVASLEKKPNASTQTAVIDQIVSFYASHVVEVRQE